MSFSMSQIQSLIRYIGRYPGFEIEKPLKEFDLEEAVRLYGPKLFRYVYTILLPENGILMSTSTVSNARYAK